MRADPAGRRGGDASRSRRRAGLAEDAGDGAYWGGSDPVFEGP